MKINIQENTVNRKIANHILTGLALGIAVPVFLTSPFGLYYLIKGSAKYFFQRSDFHREIRRLEKRGYVALTKTPEGWTVRLLAKGRKRFAEAQMQTLTLSVSEKWDHKWRLFIFDIPETQRSRRDLIRKKLKDLGMYNIQRSVFAYPYDCREELGFITDYYGLAKYTTYAVVGSIDIDKELRKHFGVS